MNVRVRDYQPQDREAFRRLNEEWLNRYFAIEEKDRHLFDDPERRIIATGGVIFILELNGEQVGCCALLDKEDETFEVAKMSITEAHQGKGWGKLLLQACIDRGKLLGKRRLFLETNRKLAAAIALYRKMGFVEVASDQSPPSEYVRVDMFMELRLSRR